MDNIVIEFVGSYINVTRAECVFIPKAIVIVKKTIGKSDIIFINDGFPEDFVP